MPVLSLGTQPEAKVSGELVKSKCGLFFEALVLMIGSLLAMDTEILKNRNKDLMLSDGDITTFE